MTIEEIDVLVIGAGPSGTVAASILNQNGIKTKIIEKQLFPRFVIGESLLPRCMEHFEAAGFIDAIEKKGFQQKFGAVFQMNKASCDFDFSERFTEGWTWTWQVPRADFDKTLADEVERMGVPIEYETSVTEVAFSGSISTTTVVDKYGHSKKIKAKYIIDSSGYGRVLARLLNLDKPSNFPARKSVFCHINDPHRPVGLDANRIRVIALDKDLWCWIIPFSNGNTSVGFVGFPEKIDNMGTTAKEKYQAYLSHQDIPERLKKGNFIFDVTEISGYAVSTHQLYGDGFVLTGNASEFLDPIFSSGVTFATESGHLAAKLVVKSLKNEPVDWETAYKKQIMLGVDTFRTYVSSWYNGDLQSIFFNDSVEISIKNKICSVLAGYVWDKKNPFVARHSISVRNLAKFLKNGGKMVP
jgi:flavin-dependent dehydrogenase